MLQDIWPLKAGLVQRCLVAHSLAKLIFINCLFSISLPVEMQMLWDCCPVYSWYVTHTQTGLASLLPCLPLNIPLSFKLSSWRRAHSRTHTCTHMLTHSHSLSQARIKHEVTIEHNNKYKNKNKVPLIGFSKRTHRVLSFVRNFVLSRQYSIVSSDRVAHDSGGIRRICGRMRFIE